MMDSSANSAILGTLFLWEWPILSSSYLLLGPEYSWVALTHSCFQSRGQGIKFQQREQCDHFSHAIICKSQSFWQLSLSASADDMFYCFLINGTLIERLNLATSFLTHCLWNDAEICIVLFRCFYFAKIFNTFRAMNNKNIFLRVTSNLWLID
jgi:hypothetical protein